jgi:hypothetical protein
MKRLLRGSVLLAVAVGFLSCSGDPTDGFREPSGIVASPTVVFVDVGDTKAVVASLQDDQGNQIASDFEISAVGSGLTVVQDTAFQHTNTGASIPNQVRFQVTGTAIANSSFTLTAGGETLVVPVRVTPGTVALGISNPTPQWGDTLVLTAPAGVLFTDSSEVTFTSAGAGDVVGVSADRTQLTVVPGPNANGPVIVDHTTVAFDEGLDFTITSEGTVVSPPLTELAVVFSNPTPALGEAVTMTLPTGVRVLPDSFPFLPDSTHGVLADSGLIIQGAANPLNVTVSADSSQISFIPQPNSDSVLVITGVVPSRLPQFPQTLATTNKITTPNIDSMPATLSDKGPDIGEVVTLTAGAGFTFSRTATLAWGANAAIVTNVSADSTVLSVLPPPDAVGRPIVNGVRVAAAPIFRLTRPATDSLDVATTSVFTGKDDPATAPVVTIPPVGTDTTEFFDATIVDQFYRLDITTANTILAIRADWPTGADVDLLVCRNTCSVGADFPFGFAGATAAHPENHTVTFVTPGTYFVYINLFAGATPFHRVRLIRTQ